MNATDNRQEMRQDEERRQPRAHEQNTVPELAEEDAPARYEQDTQPVDGEVATHLPPEEESGVRQPIQG
ncbi:MAG: hypothetical protein ACK47B_09075 [Armatimonadota bacterium]